MASCRELSALCLTPSSRSSQTAAETQLSLLLDKQKDETKKYGKMPINNGDYSILAVDDWGNVCYDALMLSIPVSERVATNTPLLNPDGLARRQLTLLKGNAKRV